ncbi:MAG: DUF362 domain-containing protein [Deltaproteobacteria bacterium]|nr:DUF362 domain-containing protein [Deltaproteobacteria bacterium]
MARVLLRRCDDYDPDRIRAIIGECMDELGLKPAGRTMVKPNTVIAHDHFFPHSYTRSEFLDGLLGALRERDDEVTELSVGERCGITIPTRFAFAQAHYPKVLRRHRARPRYFDEMPQVRRNLFAEGRLRDYLYIPEAVAETEWYVSAPKFKAHPWTKVTFNLKLYIGIQDDEHRLIDHDHRLHTKIADLYEVIQPKLCAMDAITAGAKSMLVPEPYPLGLIIVSDDAVAADAVSTHIVGLDPREVDHIRIVAERGWGPIDLEQIEIDGDCTLDEARARASGFGLALERVDENLNRDSNLKVYAGPPPDTYDYCWGGCPGALQEGLAVIERLQPEVKKEIEPIHIVFGAYQGPIEVEGDEKVLFIGDCACWKGEIAGEPVEIESRYRERHLIRPESVKATDLPGKITKVLGERLQALGKRVIRVPGCTVSVAENVLYLSALGKTKNPYYDPRMVFGFAWHWSATKLFRLLGRLRAPHPEALQQPDRPA